jgi:hypothetical protein
MRKNVVQTSILPTSDSAPRTRWIHGRTALLIAFAFSVMADPVSSVAYAIEVALRALHGNLALLPPAMGLVVVVVAVIVLSLTMGEPSATLPVVETESAPPLAVILAFPVAMALATSASCVSTPSPCSSASSWGSSRWRRLRRATMSLRARDRVSPTLTP